MVKHKNAKARRDWNIGNRRCECGGQLAEKAPGVLECVRGCGRYDAQTSISGALEFNKAKEIRKDRQ